MRYRYLFPGMLDYPAGLAAVWRGGQLPVLTVAGNTALLQLPTMCLLSSSEIPPDLILPAFDLALRLRSLGVAVAGGFQGEVEAVCLSVLMGGSGPLVICPARALDAMKLSPPHQNRVADGRLVYVSSERPSCRRPTVHVAMRRNELLMGLAGRLIALSAPPGSRALKSAVGFIERGNPVACFDHRWNRDLLLLGAFPIPPAGPHLLPPSLSRRRLREPVVDPVRDFLGEPEATDAETSAVWQSADIHRPGPDGQLSGTLSRASRACR